MLLSVDNLHTHFVSRDLDNQVRTAWALNGVSFGLEAGQILGIVGETGAGKSLTATSIMGLLRPPARVVAGQALFDGRDLLQMPPAELNALRGSGIALVVQSPKSSLDPLTRIGDQLVRIQRAHRRIGQEEARRRAVAMLDAVGIPDAERRYHAWPHELSGGMAQRVIIALALVNEPRLLIADEPTTGLDVTVQAQILDLLRGLVRDTGIGAIIITHDLGIVAHHCDTVAVMFAGSVVERGPAKAILRDPQHPYTASLMAATPERLRLGTRANAGGLPPNLHALPIGCVFRSRCPQADGRCAETPPEVAVDSRMVRCHRALELAA